MFKKLFVLFAVLLPLALFSSGASAPGKTDVITLTKANTLVMDAEFSDESVAQVALEARALDEALPSWSPIYLVIYSPGGNINSGIELIDNLNAMGRKIHTITIFSASMAFQTVQGVSGTRYVTQSGTLMSHKAKGEFSGEFPGQLDSRYAYFLRRISKLDEVTVARSRGKFTLASYRAAYENEYWCEGQDCVDAGLADEVATVRCDATLSGTKSIDAKAEFMGMPIEVTVTKASCPTITAILDVKVKVAGKEVQPEDLDSFKELKLSVRNANELRILLEATIAKLNPSRDL